MSRNLSEETTLARVARQGFQARQLERRPASLTGAFELKVFSDTTVITTGDGKLIMMIPADLNGTSLLQVAAGVTTVSSSGLPTVQLRNVTTAVDMLSTKITIDASEFTSYTAATPAVINPANARVLKGARIAVDVDVAGTGAKGLIVVLVFG